MIKSLRFGIDRNMDAEAIGKLVLDHLSSMIDGSVIVTMEIKDDVDQMRKKYFAMVAELAKFAGYISHKDKELFKIQIKEAVAIPSIADIADKEQMSAAIEALYEFSAVTYNYTFKHGNEEPGIISFNN